MQRCGRYRLCLHGEGVGGRVLCFFCGVEGEVGETRVADVVFIFQVSLMTVRKADMDAKTTRCQDVKLVMMAVYDSGPKVLFFITSH